MKEYKMLCLDIDGTLLNSQGQITQPVKDAVARITFDDFVPVILVSARPAQAIEPLLDELDIMRPIICYGGAMIKEEEEILFERTFSFDEAIAVVEICEQYDVNANVYCGPDWYTQVVGELERTESEITGVQPHVVDFAQTFARLEDKGRGVHKILCMGEADNILAFEQNVSAQNRDGLTVHRSSPYYLEIMARGISKPFAVESVCKLYNFEMRDVIAIGDNFNDIGMLEAVGMGIAMGNAPDPVKASANDVVSSNDEDGVAEAINKYFPR